MLLKTAKTIAITLTWGVTLTIGYNLGTKIDRQEILPQNQISKSHHPTQRFVKNRTNHQNISNPPISGTPSSPISTRSLLLGNPSSEQIQNFIQLLSQHSEKIPQIVQKAWHTPPAPLDRSLYHTFPELTGTPVPYPHFFLLQEAKINHLLDNQQPIEMNPFFTPVGLYSTWANRDPKNMFEALMTHVAFFNQQIQKPIRETHFKSANIISTKKNAYIKNFIPLGEHASRNHLPLITRLTFNLPDSESQIKQALLTGIRAGLIQGDLETARQWADQHKDQTLHQLLNLRQQGKIIPVYPE